MKRLLLFAAIAVFGIATINAQEGIDKVIDQAKNGGFYVGANFGFSLISSNRVFNNSSNESSKAEFVLSYNLIPNDHCSLTINVGCDRR